MPALVRAALARHGLLPLDLVLELTESVLIEAGSSTLRQLTQLRESGVGIVIDDFGTGTAGLSHLARALHFGERAVGHVLRQESEPQH